MGQLFFTTEASASETMSQGVQQTYEITLISGIEDASNISMEIAAYPNPAKENLTIEVEREQLKSQKLSYRLYDMSGKVLQQKEMENSKTSFSMDELVPAIYILKVSSENKELKAFKILKK